MRIPCDTPHPLHVGLNVLHRPNQQQRHHCNSLHLDCALQRDRALHPHPPTLQPLPQPVFLVPATFQHPRRDPNQHRHHARVLQARTSLALPDRLEHRVLLHGPRPIGRAVFTSASCLAELQDAPISSVLNFR